MNAVTVVSLFFLALVIVPVLICATWDKLRVIEDPERFRPMSDDEFVAGCGPGANREVALKVRRIVSEQLNIRCEEIHPTHRFVEDLHAE